MRTTTSEKNRKNKKKKAVLEKEIFSIMQKSLKTALDQAIEELLKSFK